MYFVNYNNSINYKNLPYIILVHFKTDVSDYRVNSLICGHLYLACNVLDFIVIARFGWNHQAVNNIMEIRKDFIIFYDSDFYFNWWLLAQYLL